MERYRLKRMRRKFKGAQKEMNKGGVDWRKMMDDDKKKRKKKDKKKGSEKKKAKDREKQKAKSQTEGEGKSRKTRVMLSELHFPSVACHLVHRGMSCAGRRPSRRRRPPSR